MNWMLGIGMGTTFLGGILNMFGLGGGSTAGTTVIDDRANQNSNTRSTTRTSSETNISITNIYQQLEEMNKKLQESITDIEIFIYDLIRLSYNNV